MVLSVQQTGYDKLVQTQSRRDAAAQIMMSIEQGRCCRALGPRESGKSRLLLQVRDTLLKRSYFNVAYQSLLRLEQDNEAYLFSSIYQTLCTSTEYTPPKGVRIRTDADFKDEVLQLLRRTRRHVVLIVDDVEMAMLNLVASLLRTIRAIYMTSLNDSPFVTFRAVVCGAYVSNEVLMRAHYSGFERISDLVLIGDFDDEERLDFARLLWNSPLVADDAFPALFQHTGGDAFLIKHILRECRRSFGADRPDPLTAYDINRVIRDLIARPTQAITGALKMVEGSPELLESALEILRRGEVPRAELPLAELEVPNQLDLTGVFVQTVDYRYKIKCPLWTDLLRSHFTPVHVGSLFAASGRWDNSLNSLGSALQKGDDQAKARLFTTVINAIYTSDSVSNAFEYLARGFEMLYPSTAVELYQSKDEILTPTYPRPLSGQQRRKREISLHQVSAPEVRALQGTPYTYHAETERLFIPLRYHSVKNRTIGLVVIRFDKLKKMNYAHRADMPQLLNFVYQASEALDRLSQMLQELAVNKESARQLKTINSILSQILPKNVLTHNDIYRLMLAGVTANLGLEFNRAILFLPDTRQQRLEVGFAVGQLEYRDAKREWKRSTYNSVEALIRDVLDRPSVTTPLFDAVAPITLPLDRVSDDPIVRAFQTGEPARIRRGRGSLSAELTNRIEPISDFAVVPVSSTAQVQGVLYVDDKFLQRDISEERFELLRTFVSQIALIIEIKDEADKQRERRKTVTEITALITEKVDDLNHLYRSVLSQVQKAVPNAHHACIVELKDDRELVIPSVCRPTYQIDNEADWLPDGLHKGIDTQMGISGRAIREERAILSLDVHGDPDYIPAISSTKSQVCVPIRSKNIRAALVLESDLLNAFTEDDTRLLEALADQVAVAIRYAQLYREAEANKQIEHLRHMAELAAGLIHDVNSVVAGIPDNIKEIEEMLQHENLTNPDVQHLLTRIRVRIDNVETISERLRDYVVMKKLRPNYIDLQNVIKNAIDRETFVKPPHIEIFPLLDSSVMVYADGSWVQLVLQNLLSNAFKAIPKDKPGRIIISIKEREDDVVVRVRDNGRGISPENLPKVFDPGFSTSHDKSRMHGIGLFHCKLVVEEHGGTIKVRSKRGKGTAFMFNLPKHPWKEQRE